MQTFIQGFKKAFVTDKANGISAAMAQPWQPADCSPTQQSVRVLVGVFHASLGWDPMASQPQASHFLLPKASVHSLDFTRQVLARRLLSFPSLQEPPGRTVPPGNPSSDCFISISPREQMTGEHERRQRGMRHSPSC